MIEEQARVIAIDNQKITVESLVKSSCSACQQLEDCGSGQIAKAFPQKAVQFEITTDKKLSIGEQVIIGLPEKLLLSAAWQVYLWPLIGLMLASSFGQWLFSIGILPHELIALSLGIAGGYSGFVLAKRNQQRQACHLDWQVKLIKVLPQAIPVKQINT